MAGEKKTKKEIHCVVIKFVINGRGLCVEEFNNVDFCVHFTPVKLMTFVSLHEYFPYCVDSTQR